jgi:hypothetical protein
VSNSKLIFKLFLLFLILFLVNLKKGGPIFKDMAATSRLDQAVTDNGISLGDYNSDGLIDLITASNKLSLMENTGKGIFADVTGKSGLSQISGNITAAIWGDYNNDGHLDLYIVRHGSQEALESPGEQDLLFKNNGDGTFVDVTTDSKINCRGHGQGAAWADYNQDGSLDIFISNYGVYIYGEDWFDYKNEPSCLLKNNGDGTFSDVTSSSGITIVPKVNDPATIYPQETIKRTSMPFQPVWFDYNNDSLDDLFIGIDIGSSALFKNNGDGTFTETTQEAGLNKYGTAMGVAVGDYDNDGDLDLFVANYFENYLWKNNGDGTFVDVAKQAGVTGQGIGWGTVFFDFDNDGDLDLFVANGSMDDLTETDDITKTVTNQDLFFVNQGNGTFIQEIDENTGFKNPVVSRGAAVADLNQDGLMDLIVSQFNQLGPTYQNPIRYYQNQLNNRNHWLSVSLVGTESNSSAVGAVVSLSADNSRQIKRMSSGSSYASSSEPYLHFGLGRESIIEELTITWPNGNNQSLKDVVADQHIIIEEKL